MTNFKPHSLAITLSAIFMLSGCIVAPPLTAAEQEVQSDLDVSKYYPATREMRTNIETQPLFAQAAFWGREYDLNPSDLESAIKLSAAVRKLGNAQRAVEIAQTTRALYPRDPYLTAEFAAALIASERALDALGPLDEALRVAPNYARLWSLKGAALDQTEQYDLARQHYDRALRLTPNDPNILANLGLSYALSGDAATAETWLRRASNIPGAGPGVHQNLALVLQLQGKMAEAEKIMRLSRGEQKLPPKPVPVHQPANFNGTASQHSQSTAPQALRGAYSPNARQPIPAQTQAAKTTPSKTAGNSVATGDDLTDEQRALLNQISGTLKAQPQPVHNQTVQQTRPTAPRGYPSLTPQAQTQPQNTTSRGAARRRR